MRNRCSQSILLLYKPKKRLERGEGKKNEKRRKSHLSKYFSCPIDLTVPGCFLPSTTKCTLSTSALSLLVPVAGSPSPGPATPHRHLPLPSTRHRCAHPAPTPAPRCPPPGPHPPLQEQQQQQQHFAKSHPRPERAG